MPTLLQINSAKNCGSTGKIAEQIAIVAQSCGWETYIAHGYRYNRGGDIGSFPITGKWGEYVHIMKSILTDGHGLGSVTDTKQLISWMDYLRPDVLHLHNLHGYYVNYKILFEYLSSVRIPVVWTLHDCWAFTGHCAYFDRIGCDKWRKGCHDCPQKDSYPRSLVDRSSRNLLLKERLFTSLSSMTLVPVSDWLHGLATESFFVKYPIRTIHNGIDLSMFRPCVSDFRQKNDLGGKFLVLGVADGYGTRKGLLDFNKVSERLGDDAKIIMIGLSNSDMKNVSSKILGLPRTDCQKDLIDIYSTADVYINPTYEDNFPTTNIEALACGTPVITYDTGGSPEAIDDDTGIVVKKGDVDGLIRAINRIKQTGKSFYSQACRMRAERLFNKEDRFREYIALYDSLLSK